MKTTPVIILSLAMNESESKEKPTTENMPSCSDLIFIDVSLIPEPANWKLDNEKYLSDSQPFDVKLATIDPNKIYLNEYPRWLVKNQDYICYEKTSDYIECIHTITDQDQDLRRAVDLAPIHSTLTLGEIKAQITRNGGDFNTTKYDRYVSFNDNWQNQIVVSLLPFVVSGNCYSFPLLRKLASSKGLTDNSVFQFKEVEYFDGKGKGIVLIIEHDSLTSTYVNFSHIPPFVDNVTIFAS